jgi:hypothetical protein
MATNISQIPAPRVPLVDIQTNTVSREWFIWFNNIYSITGNGSGITSVINGGTGLGTLPGNGQLLIGNGSGYALRTLFAGAGISVTNGAGVISLANTGVLSNVAGTGISVSSATGNVTLAIDGTVATLPANQIFTGTNTFSGGFSRGAPVTKTTDFTLAANENWIITNNSSATTTVTLPSASFSGRELMFQNYQLQAVVSASSNVVPLGGGSASTGILAGLVAGEWATLVSDGTNWIIMQAG